MARCIEILRKSATTIRKMLEISGINFVRNFYFSFHYFICVLSIQPAADPAFRRARERREARDEEVRVLEGDQVAVDLPQVRVELPREPQRAGHARPPYINVKMHFSPRKCMFCDILPICLLNFGGLVLGCIEADVCE